MRKITLLSAGACVGVLVWLCFGQHSDVGLGRSSAEAPIGSTGTSLPSASPPLASGGAQIDASPAAQVGQLFRPAKSVDWARIPQGLEALAQEAVQSSDGGRAYFAARALAQCQALPSERSALERAIHLVQDPAVRRELIGEYESSGRVNAQCQSVVGDLEVRRLTLLNLAASQGVAGATADLVALTNIRPNESQWKSIAADAEGGDLLSLSQIVAAGRIGGGLSDKQFAGYKLALSQIASDPELKTKESLTEFVELLRVTAPYGERKAGQTSFSDLSESIENEYRQDEDVKALSARILANVRKSAGLKASAS